MHVTSVEGTLLLEDEQLRSGGTLSEPSLLLRILALEIVAELVHRTSLHSELKHLKTCLWYGRHRVLDLIHTDRGNALSAY